MATRKSELVITCNAKGVQNVMNFLNEKLGSIKQRLQEINSEASKNGWTDQLEKEFKQLTQEATGIDNIINRNQETMKKYGEVMKDLAGSKLRDLKKALQEGKNALNKMTEDDPRRARLVGDLEKIARQMKNIQASSVSMREAVRNLKDLGNVSFDKLTQGLDAVNQRLTSGKLKDKDRTKLQGFAQQYQAEIAYRQSQTAVTNRNVGSLNAQQLRSEQSAINSAMAAMSGVAGYEKYMAKYEVRLKEVNQQLAILSEKERKAAEDAKRLAQTQQAAKTVQAVYRGQKVSLEDLQKAYKTLEDRVKQYSGTNDAKAKSARQQIDALRGAMMQLGAIRPPQVGASLNRIIGGDMTTATKDQLQVAQRQLQSMLNTLDQMPNKARQADTVRTALKNITTQLNLLTEAEKKADAAARELQATQQAAKTVQAVYRGQAVSLEELNAAYKTLEARSAKYNGVNPAKFKTTQQQMKALETQIKRLNGTLLSEQQLQDRIAHSGKYSVKQLQEAYNQLQAKLNTLHTNEHVAIRATQRQMKALQQEINRATGQVSGFAKAWQTAKQNIMMYVGVFAIVNKVKSALSGLVSKNKELSDSMANIRKVSQWASSDVVKLTENLAKIDTRNTITTLQNLAYQGAKLGIGQYGVEGLTGFVRAAEQVQTALGEDLGEEALPALAKLTEVMGLIPKMGVEQAMQRAGSAIYQLGASSTATGKNIVEFSKRLMGLANVSGVTADELLGLGSAADSMALMPEVAATAFNKLFNSIHGNTANIAKAVGIAKEELEGLLYEGNTMGALVKVFEKMQTMSMKELEGRGVFKELGSDGARLTNVMITMANKVDMLRFHLETSNKAFSEGKAIINEYLIQQETAAAYFDRAANIWTKAFVNPEGVDIVKQLAQEWYNVSWEMTHSASTMAGIKITLEALAGTVKMLITYLPTLVQLLMCYGVGASLQAIYREFQAIYAAATMAGTATARLNALLKTNAFALAVTGVLMLVAKYWELAEAEKAVAAEEEKRQHIFSDAAAEAIQTYNKQKEALDKYHDALKKSNSTEEERNEIIRRFKGEFGSYLEKLGIEIETYQDMENALHRVNKELKDKAYYETGQKLRESYVGDAKQAQTNALSKFMQAAQKYNIPTTLMEDIVEGKITTIEAAMEAANQGMTNLGNKWGWEHLRDEEAERANRSTFGKMRDNFMDFFGGSPAERVTTQRTQDIYRAVNDLLKASNEVRSRDEQVDKFIEQYADKYSPNISVEGAIGNLKRLKELNEDKLNEALNVLRDEWKNMSEKDRKTERGQQIGSAIDQYSKQIRSMRGEGYEAPPSKKELAKQEAERKKALRAEMKEEQTQAKAIIDNVKNYYQRQINAITELATETGMDKDMQKQMVDGMTIRMNDALANVRKAIGGTKNEWETFKQSMRQDLFEPLDENGENFSLELLDKIMDNNLVKLREMIQKLSKELNQQGSVLLDQILRKATEEEGKKSKLANELMRAREKELLEKNYTGKVDKDAVQTMDQFGIGAVTSQQARQIRDWSQQGNFKAIDDFLEMRNKYWQVALDNARENLVQLMQTDISKKEGQDMALNLLFGEYWKEALTGSQLEGLLNMTADQWQVFYMKLIEYTDNWTDAQKKAYDEVKKRQDFLFNERADVKRVDLAAQGLESMGKQQERTGKPQPVGRALGVVDTIANDPELLRLELLAIKADWYYDHVKELREKNQASEAEMTEAMQKSADAQMAVQDKMASLMQERISAMQQWLDPIEDFGKSAGDAFAQMTFDAEKGRDALKSATEAVARSVADQTTKMVKEWMMQLIQKKLYSKLMQKEEKKTQGQMTDIAEEGGEARMAAETVLNHGIAAVTKQASSMILSTKKQQTQEELTQEGVKAEAKVAAGTAEAAATTLGTLGWWGIPLVAVITALLQGLLSFALGKLFGSGESKSTDTNKKVKLASGMLTYDEGNVRTVVGDDGRVYRAKEQRSLPEGVSMVTEPIATRVNGQQALVGERGPEIVIGRRTTRAIQMNRPDLLRDLAMIDRGITTRKVRTFDEGNLSDLASAIRPTDASTESAANDGSQTIDAATAEALRQMPAAMAAFAQVMTVIQKQGIPANLNMYGDNGAYKKFQQADKFYKKYGG